MREPPRHLAPGRVALRLDEFGDVVEHDDVSLAAGQRRGAAMERAPSPGGGDADLFAAFARALGDGPQPFEQVVHQGRETGVPVRQGIEGGADHRVEVGAEDLRRGMVGGDEAVVAVQREHAGGQPPQHGFEVGALRLDETLARARLVMRPLELAGHVVERRDQEPDLVPGRARELGLEVPAGDRPGALGEILQRGDHAPRGAERGVHRGEQAGQQDDGQREGEAELQGPAEVRQLAVLGRRRLHAVRQRVHPLGHGKERLQQQRLGGRLLRGYRHHHLHVQSTVPDVVQPDVVAGPPRLLHDRIAEAARDHRGRIGVARSDDTSVRADEGELRRPAQAPGVVECADRLLVAERLEVRRDSRGLREELPHPYAERGAAEVQRIVQRRFDAHVEPGVDPAVQELEREVVDDGDRGHGQDHEDDHHPHREPGPRTPIPCLAEQVVQVPGDQGAQADQRRGVDRQQGGVELAEPGGVLRGAAHEVRRSEKDQTQRDDRAGALPEAARHSIRHSNHPLPSRHAGLR